MAKDAKDGGARYFDGDGFLIYARVTPPLKKIIVGCCRAYNCTIGDFVREAVKAQLIRGVDSL